MRFPSGTGTTSPVIVLTAHASPGFQPVRSSPSAVLRVRRVNRAWPPVFPSRSSMRVPSRSRNAARSCASFFRNVARSMLPFSVSFT
uniref:Uncharacterized protein n=1 Tax=Streptomyces phage Geonosis TaxID=3158856 RepID=A0AAU7GWG2_9CAUD